MGNRHWQILAGSVLALALMGTATAADHRVSEEDSTLAFSGKVDGEAFDGQFHRFYGQIRFDADSEYRHWLHCKPLTALQPDPAQNDGQVQPNLRPRVEQPKRQRGGRRIAKRKLLEVRRPLPLKIGTQAFLQCDDRRCV